MFFATKKTQLTETQRQIKDAEPNVQPEEKDHIGYFAKQEQVAHVLLHCDWERRKRGKNEFSSEGKQGAFALLRQGQREDR